MKLKTIEQDGKTYAEVLDGKPVYVDDSGKEVAFDAPGTIATISRLNGEAKTNRERAEAAEKAAKAFEGISDPAAAMKALETIRNLDDKKLIDAGEVEKVKAETIKALEEKYKPTVEKAAALEQQLRAEKIGGSFARSKFIADKLAVPVPMIEATFGKHFDLDGGKIVAKDQNGNAIYSKARPGEVADFDEALETLVEAFPYRDSIMKGLQQSGGGAKPGAGGTGGAKTMTRAEFDAMPMPDRQAKLGEGFTVSE
ncbi:DUF6651 domain-containing protein [Salipiger marinus]|uniref:DUF6651 domain-containing protein n=1 Tax=Salipiger marinus TaxID=555512 RepID=UPI002BC5DEAD|nr:DUF6651 domain-containing protein [Salipiger manganoxidans]MEB3419913.1 DUF6651 domain-containing protein [Salipiger manganoxidans]